MSAQYIFNPQAFSLAQSVAGVRRTLNEPGVRDDQYALFLRGVLAGETSFALALNQDCPVQTLVGAREELLARLGLIGEQTDHERECLRGWVCGLMDSLIEVFDQQVDEEVGE